MKKKNSKYVTYTNLPVAHLKLAKSVEIVAGEAMRYRSGSLRLRSRKTDYYCVQRWIARDGRR
jgi:hypothetical protein